MNSVGLSLSGGSLLAATEAGHLDLTELTLSSLDSTDGCVDSRVRNTKSDSQLDEFDSKFTHDIPPSRTSGVSRENRKVSLIILMPKKGGCFALY